MDSMAENPMRHRLLEAATTLFYAQGLRAVSVDKVIEAAATTKVTFYRHFKSKDDLIVAYLNGRAVLERAGMRAAAEQGDGDVDLTLRLISEQIGVFACAPGFRGCPFINAAAEYPDPSSAVRQTVEAHRQWCRTYFAGLAQPIGATDPQDVANDLMLIRDGTMVAGYLDDPATIAETFLRSGRAVLGLGGDTAS